MKLSHIESWIMYQFKTNDIYITPEIARAINQLSKEITKTSVLGYDENLKRLVCHLTGMLIETENNIATGKI